MCVYVRVCVFPPCHEGVRHGGCSVSRSCPGSCLVRGAFPRPRERSFESPAGQLGGKVLYAVLLLTCHRPHSCHTFRLPQRLSYCCHLSLQYCLPTATCHLHTLPHCPLPPSQPPYQHSTNPRGVSFVSVSSAAVSLSPLRHLLLSHCVLFVTCCCHAVHPSLPVPIVTCPCYPEHPILLSPAEVMMKCLSHSSPTLFHPTHTLPCDFLCSPEVPSCRHDPTVCVCVSWARRPPPP